MEGKSDRNAAVIAAMLVAKSKPSALALIIIGRSLKQRQTYNLLLLR